MLLALGIAWRTIRYALAFPLWGDEAFLALSIITRTVRGLAQPLEFGQIAPPGFLWVEWGVVQLFGHGERALRLVPYLASVGSLLLLRRFTRDVAGPRVLLIAVALLAASFYPARHGNEVKPYTLDMLVSLALMTLGWRVWLAPVAGWRWAALIAAAGAGVWCSYPAVFVAASVGVFVGVKAWREGTPRTRGLTVLYGAVLALSCGAMTLAFALPQAQANAWLMDLVTWRNAFPPLSRPWKLPWWLLEIHTGHMVAYPHGGHRFGSTPTFLLIVAGIWALWRTPERRPLLWLLLGPLTFALAAAALRKYPYGTSARVMLYMAPAFCVLAAEGVVTLLRLCGRRALVYGPVTIAGLLGLLMTGWMLSDVSAPYVRRSDQQKRELVREWAADTNPNDRWVVFDGATPLPQVPDVMLSHWVQRVAEFRYDVRSLAPVPVSWEPDPATIAPPSAGRIWLLVHHHGCAPLYPEARLVDYERTLTARFGPPIVSQPAIVEGSALFVRVYSP